MKNKEKNIPNKIKGTIYGALVGNTLASAAIGMTHKDILATCGINGLKQITSSLSKSTYQNHEPGKLLADYYQMQALITPILNSPNSFTQGKFDQDSIVKSLVQLLGNEAFLDANPSLSALIALRKMTENTDYCLIGEESIHASGALRSLAIGLLPKDKYNLIDLALAQANLTYDDSQMQASSAVIVNSISFLLTNDLTSPDSVKAYINTQMDLATQISPKFADAWDNVAPDLDYSEEALVLPYSLINILPTVDELVPSAVGIFLIFRNNFESACANAAIAGGATDMAGFLVGGLAGAYNGFDAIPSRWLEKLTHKDEINNLVNNIIGLWDI